jgi:large subunit ribosomal protein L20
MVRTKYTPARKRKKKRILKAAKGYYGAKSRLYRTAKEAVTRSLVYAYRDRKRKKRDFRKLWISRINAACRNQGMSYNRLINGLKNAKIEIDRKILSDLAINDPDTFTQLVDIAKKNTTENAEEVSDQ